MQNRFFKDWFSFSQGERKGIIFLALLLLFLLILPPFFRSCSSQKTADIEQLRRLSAQLNETSIEDARSFYSNELQLVDKKVQPQNFAFNPNTLSRDSFLLLGFSEKQAAAIIKYRERGSGFRTAADFFKLNVVTEKQRERLQQHAFVPAFSKEKTTAKKDTFTRKVYEKPQQILVELNTADTALLQTLPGIGAYFAQKIVEYREALGGYVSAEQLLEIRNFGHERVQRLAGRVSVDTSRVQKMTLSEESVEIMRRHPYLGAYAARGAVQFAKRKGSPATIDELLSNNVLTSLQAHRLRPYVK
ncbi:MAG: helix-hairpin-helix domain-containing protein [Prevotellaceae bacterium]|jgi:competence ComEA-like helix-hairpin-helix protein|nr:helix-hairpin-helix domain-containing protein [Prevotellaceae bacterium]